MIAPAEERRVWIVVASLMVLAVCYEASAQPVPGGVCQSVPERNTEVGCWVIANQPVGQLARPEVFWHLDAYPNRAAAEQAKGSRGTVIESMGRVWLLSIEAAGWRPTGGERVAEIGPLPVIAGETYTAQYMEAIFTPGMIAPTHTHPGPEAWYTLAGETCLETPRGKQVGRAGGPPVIVPARADSRAPAGAGRGGRRAEVLARCTSAAAGVAVLIFGDHRRLALFSARAARRLVLDDAASPSRRRLTGLKRRLRSAQTPDRHRDHPRL